MIKSDKSVGDDLSTLAHDAAQTAERAAYSARSGIGQGLHEMSSGLDHARSETGNALRQLASESDALLHRGMDKVRDASGQLREKSLHAKDAATTYIQHEPMKSVLIAAAVGAGLMALVALFSRNHHSGR
ncbi:hypothetical protein [Hydrogenophaga sp.]|uniref:hypothetical protein n=1 Tax=Hydrogenophaga sp. TaxID=1904254 RepID=UPI002731AD7E|nr:hypothetical protein [Hydrogenophaga sp.]MDP2017711.1 hypothetical protein [Hydrogenophaga sp.]MDP3167585.1 hypothetical protein [Hydrogenophaga sp.]MDP3810815.1 hypothetical protein [Hydrogenophaga sp.]